MLFDRTNDNAAKIEETLQSEVGKLSKPLKEFPVLSSRMIPFTTALATKFLELPELSCERKVCEKHVNELAQCMSEGTFLMHEAGIAIAVCAFDGNSERRLNGQHTCWARLQMSESWEPSIRVTRYRADTEDDYRLLYAHFDNHKARTRSHRGNVLMAGVEELPDLPPTVIRMLIQGYSFWYAWMDTSKKPRLEDVAQALRFEMNKVALRAAPVLRRISGDNAMQFAKRQPVYAAVFETFNKAQADSESFWEQVLGGENLVRGMPAYWLRTWLASHKTSTASAKTAQTTTPEIYNYCIDAWNAFRAGTQMTKAIGRKPGVRVVAR